MIEILKLITHLPEVNSPEDEDAYLKEWEAVGFELHSWQNVTVAKTWYGLNHSDMGFGELLAIMIELLPTNEKFLKLLQQKLEIALRVTGGDDEATAAFFNLNTALIVKLDTKHPEFKNVPAEERIKNNKVINELRRLESLKYACSEMSRDLLMELDARLKKYDFYKLYVKTNLEDAFNTIHDDLLLGKLPLADNAEEVKLIKKTMALRDIYCTLIKKDYPEHRALILKNKLEDYKKLFGNELEGLGGIKSIIHHSLFYFSPVSRFFVLCDSITRNAPKP